MNLGLAMIVKSGGQELRLCLASIANFANQIVIVDTGVESDTRTVASEFGATVIPFEWGDHFAEARNVGLREMKTDWVLVLDADEELEPGAQASIATLLDSCAETVGGFHVVSRHYMPTKYVHTLRGISTPNEDGNERARNAPSWVETGVCRLFRRHPGIFFTGRIHEKVEPQIDSLGMQIKPASFRIRHYGRLVDQGNRQAKDHYYYRLCLLKAEEEPENAEAWLEAGLVAFETIKDMVEAQRSLERAVAINRDFPIAWLVMTLIHLKAGRFLEALRASDFVPDRQPLGMLKHAARGDAFHGLKRLKEAQRAYRKALGICRQLPALEFCSLLTDLESKLGYTNVGLGLIEPGLTRLRRASEQAAHSFDTQDRLMKGYLLAGRIDDAAQTSAAIARRFRDPRLYVRSAAIQIQAGQIEDAGTILDEAIATYPLDPSLSQIRSELNLLRTIQLSQNRSNSEIGARI